MAMAGGVHRWGRRHKPGAPWNAVSLDFPGIGRLVRAVWVGSQTDQHPFAARIVDRNLRPASAGDSRALWSARRPHFALEHRIALVVGHRDRRSLAHVRRRRSTPATFDHGFPPIYRAHPAVFGGGAALP